MPMLPQVGALAVADTERALAAVLEGRTVLATAVAISGSEEPLGSCG